MWQGGSAAPPHQISIEGAGGSKSVLSPY